MVDPVIVSDICDFLPIWIGCCNLSLKYKDVVGFNKSINQLIYKKMIYKYFLKSMNRFQ